MGRSLLLKVMTAAVLLGSIALIAPGVAEAAPMATGTVNCPVLSGRGTLSPGLTAGGSPGGVKITFHAVLGATAAAGCSSSATLPSGLPVTIRKGKLTGSGFFNGPAPATGNSCANFDGPDILGSIKAKVHWVASSPIAPSKVTYTGGTPAVSGTPTDTISLPATGTTTVKSGSLALPPLPDSIKLVTNIPASCLPSAPPVATFSITGGSVSL